MNKHEIVGGETIQIKINSYALGKSEYKTNTNEKSINIHRALILL